MIKVNKQLTMDYLWRVLQIFGKEGIVFIIFFVSAKLLSPLQFGVYNYLVAFLAFLVIFGDFGISTSTTKFIAENYDSDSEELKHVLFNITLVIVLIGLLISIPLLIFDKTLLKQGSQYIFLIIPLIFTVPMTSLFDGIYRAKGKFKKLSLISVVTGFITIIFTFILIKKYMLLGALISQNIFYALLLLALIIFNKNEFKFKYNLNIIKKIGKYSLILGIVSLTYFFFGRVNTLILGQYGYFIQVGYYELITKIILIITMPFTIFTQVIGPQISRMTKDRKQEELYKMYIDYVIVSLLIGVLIVFLSYTIIPLLFKLYLNKYYTQEFIFALKILSIGFITQGAGIVASNAFSVSMGNGKINMYFLLFLAPINIVTSIIFLNLDGFRGMIYAVTIVQFISDIVFIVVYGKILRKGSVLLKN